MPMNPKTLKLLLTNNSSLIASIWAMVIEYYGNGQYNIHDYHCTILKTTLNFGGLLSLANKLKQEMDALTHEMEHNAEMDDTDYARFKLVRKLLPTIRRRISDSETMGLITFPLSNLGVGWCQVCFATVPGRQEYCTLHSNISSLMDWFRESSTLPIAPHHTVYRYGTIENDLALPSTLNLGLDGKIQCQINPTQYIKNHVSTWMTGRVNRDGEPEIGIRVRVLHSGQTQEVTIGYLRAANPNCNFPTDGEFLEQLRNTLNR